MLTCLGAPEYGPWQHRAAHPPWRSAPSIHQLKVLWSAHIWELQKEMQMS